MSYKQDLINIVADDLRFLQRTWHNNIGNHSLRRGSTVLRSLLVEGTLQRAWKAIGFDNQPQITTFSLTETLEKVPKEKIIFAAAGGAHYLNVFIGPRLMVNESLMTEAEMQAKNSIGLSEEVLDLLSFIEAPCVVAEGYVVQRRVLVKYVANALGGAHFNPKRNRKEGKVFEILDKATEKFKFEDKDLTYFELLSIGQAIASSNDIEKFCREAGV